MLYNIPPELQRLPQWVGAGPNKLPLNPRTGGPADVTDPATWGTFEEACRCGYKHVGFVLSKADPYCIIDLDDPTTCKGADGQQVPDPDSAAVAARTARHAKILELFESYAELSQSGKGVHIIVRGKVPHGCRRDKVEVYSDARYMICTGNVYRPSPVVEAQALLDVLFAEMTKEQASTVELTQVQGILSDEQVWEMATNAVNGDKFTALWKGEWKGNPLYPSQSEADFALMAMLGFYSKDNDQCRRLFRMSALGKRDKAVRNDKYLNFALAKIRAKETPPVDFNQLIERTNHALASTAPNGNQTPAETPRAEVSGPDAGGGEADAGTDGAEPEVDDAGGTYSQNHDREKPIAYPPGFVGELAEYIYSSAIRPVPEIGLATAIALTAGVVGRSYNISGTGLNQYLIILAKTGSGKEGAATGIDAMVSAVRSQVPMADEFIGPSAFASGQALIRVLDKQPCFVSVLGEVGLTLQQICDPKASSAQVVLKKVLLDIYNKSGFSKILRSSVYSDVEKNTKVIQAPNVTILGESTPETFYTGLDAANIAEGLVPRFSIFEYTGPRPPRNPHAFTPPDTGLVNKFAELLAVALATTQNRTHMPVAVNGDAQQLFDGFDEHADAQINGASQDVVLQLWNRAHLKALKMAALIAVGCNPHQPIVDRACAEWAIELVCRDIRKLLTRFEAGEVGDGDLRMEADTKRAFQLYLQSNPGTRAHYKTPVKLLDQPLVPYSFLRRRLRLLASFKNDRRGATAALNATLADMEKAGVIVQVPPLQARQNFDINSPIYGLGPHWNS